MSVSALADRVREFSERLSALDSMWSDYHASVMRALELWHDLRREVQSRIAELQGLIDYCQDRLRDVQVKARIGLISEEEASRICEELRRTLDESAATLESLRSELSRLEGRVEEHVRRLMAEFLISDAEEFARRAARIEELYREGRIGEGLYRKVMSLMSLLRSGGSAAGESSS